jgi:hypothetical protein
MREERKVRNEEAQNSAGSPINAEQADAIRIPDKATQYHAKSLLKSATEEHKH